MIKEIVVKYSPCILQALNSLSTVKLLCRKHMEKWGYFTKKFNLGHFVQCDWFYMVPFDTMLIYGLKMWFLCYAETFKNAL